MSNDTFRPLSAAVGPIVERLRRLDLIADADTVALLDRHRPAHPPRDPAAMIESLIVELVDHADICTENAREYLDAVQSVGERIAALKRL